MAMFYWIIMNVVTMLLKIVLVSKRVLPITSLPDAAFTFSGST